MVKIQLGLMHWGERQVCETAVCLDALHDFALVYEFRAASICRQFFLLSIGIFSILF